MILWCRYDVRHSTPVFGRTRHHAIAEYRAVAPTAVTSLGTTHTLRAHSTGCSAGRYTADVQLALPDRMDCGASISVPATLQAGPCSTYKNPAQCPQKFTISLKVPGATLCTASPVEKKRASTPRFATYLEVDVAVNHGTTAEVRC